MRSPLLAQLDEMVGGERMHVVEAAAAEAAAVASGDSECGSGGEASAAGMAARPRAAAAEKAQPGGATCGAITIHIGP